MYQLNTNGQSALRGQFIPMVLNLKPQVPPRGQGAKLSSQMQLHFASACCKGKLHFLSTDFDEYASN